MAFDHRGRGASEGDPRGEINVWVQAHGYLEAIGFIRGSGELGPSPIAL